MLKEAVGRGARGDQALLSMGLANFADGPMPNIRVAGGNFITAQPRHQSTAWT